MFGIRTAAESTSQDASTANVIEIGYSSGHPELGVKITGSGDSNQIFITLENLLKIQKLQDQASAGEGKTPTPFPEILLVNEQSQLAISAISQGHKENGTAEEAASKIQGIPGLSGITLDTAIAILMAFLAQYAQKVLENLLDDSAESTAKILEKRLGKSANTLKEKLKHIIADPSSVESGQRPLAGGFEHTLNAETFAKVNALKEELSRRASSEPGAGNRPSSSFGPLPSRQTGQPILQPGWSSALFDPFIGESDQPASYKSANEQKALDALLNSILPREKAENESPLPSPASEDGSASSTPPNPYQAFSWLNQEPFKLSQPAVDTLLTDYNSWLSQEPYNSSQPLHYPYKDSSAPMNFATIEAFRIAALEVYEAFAAEVDRKSAEFLANYIRYRIADEALTAFTSSVHVLALQRIVDASILSSLLEVRLPTSLYPGAKLLPLRTTVTDHSYSAGQLGYQPGHGPGRR